MKYPQLSSYLLIKDWNFPTKVRNKAKEPSLSLWCCCTGLFAKDIRNSRNTKTKMRTIKLFIDDITKYREFSEDMTKTMTILNKIP